MMAISRQVLDSVNSVVHILLHAMYLSHLFQIKRFLMNIHVANPQRATSGKLCYHSRGIVFNKIQVERMTVMVFLNVKGNIELEKGHYTYCDIKSWN